MFLSVFGWSQVLVPKDANLLGRMVEVDIVSTGKHYLMADLFKAGAVQRPVSVPPPLQHGQVSGVPAAQVRGVYNMCTV